ncbi:hypothetical protein NPIL_585831 [Nephila pilipes]|nr:hypothetical protein NPIL_585831 [Nephila pilipes]
MVHEILKSPVKAGRTLSTMAEPLKNTDGLEEIRPTTHLLWLRVSKYQKVQMPACNLTVQKDDILSSSLSHVNFYSFYNAGHPFNQYSDHINHLKFGDAVEFEMTYGQRTGKPTASPVCKITLQEGEMTSKKVSPVIKFGQLCIP